MSAFCRVCNAQQISSASDTYVSCRNCGSFACVQHHVWWGVSKNAFCTICFPKQAAHAVGSAQQALATVVRNADANGVGPLYKSLDSIAQEYRDMSLEDLIALLNKILLEILRRDTAADE